MNQWRIYTGRGEPHDGIRRLPPPPPWRAFTGRIVDALPIDEDDDFMKRMLARGEVFQASEEVVELVNAALYLRRPLLVSGKPGYGKSSLAYAVARELKLGPVLRWSITTRTTLVDGLYSYDAIARLQDTSYRRGTTTDDTPTSRYWTIYGSPSFRGKGPEEIMKHPPIKCASADADDYDNHSLDA